MHPGLVLIQVEPAIGGGDVADVLVGVKEHVAGGPQAMVTSGPPVMDAGKQEADGNDQDDDQPESHVEPPCCHAARVTSMAAVTARDIYQLGDVLERPCPIVGRVVVVGATVVVVVAAAVLGLSVWPAHPATNTTSRIETTRRTTE